MNPMLTRQETCATVGEGLHEALKGLDVVVVQWILRKGIITNYCSSFLLSSQQDETCHIMSQLNALHDRAWIGSPKLSLTRASENNASRIFCVRTDGVISAQFVSPVSLRGTKRTCHAYACTYKNHQKSTLEFRMGISKELNITYIIALLPCLHSSLKGTPIRLERFQRSMQKGQ